MFVLRCKYTNNSKNVNSKVVKFFELHRKRPERARLFLMKYLEAFLIYYFDFAMERAEHVVLVTLHKRSAVWGKR